MEMQAIWAEESLKPAALTTAPPVVDSSSDEIWLRFSKMPQLPKTEPPSHPVRTVIARRDDVHHIGPANCTTTRLNSSRERDGPPSVDLVAEENIAASSEQDALGQSIQTRQLSKENNGAASGKDRVQNQAVSALVAENASEVVVNGHRAFYIAEGYYALPTFPVSTDHLDLWRVLFCPRLESELLQVFRKERCQLEFLMFATKNGRAEPGILLTCLYEKSKLSARDCEKLRRKIQKKVNKFESLRECLFPCRVSVDCIRFLAFVREYRSDQEGPKTHINCKSPLSSMTMCGVLLQVIPFGRKDPVYCTLGGLLTIGGTVYGLTVRHPSGLPSSEGNEPRSCSSSEHSFSELLIDSEDSDGGDDTVSSSLSNDLPTTLPCLARNEGRDRAINSEAPLASNDFHDEQDKDPSCYSSFGTFHIPPFGDIFREVDAMLVGLTDTSHVLPNKYRPPNSTEWTRITDVARKDTDHFLPNLDVFVIAGVSGIVPGKFGQSGVNLEISGNFYCATQIILERVLVPGDSGSWVVQGSTLAGYIIAGRATYPWAYMIPITEFLKFVDQLYLPWTLETWPSQRAQSILKDPNVDQERSSKPTLNFRPPVPIGLSTYQAKLPDEKTKSNTDSLVRLKGETTVFTPSMSSSAFEGTSISKMALDLLRALGPPTYQAKLPDEKTKSNADSLVRLKGETTVFTPSMSSSAFEGTSISKIVDLLRALGPPNPKHRNTSPSNERRRDEARLVFNKVIAGHYRAEANEYSQVGALFVTWALNYLPFNGEDSEVTQLRSIFDRDLGYYTDAFEIPPERPASALNKKVADFVDKYGEENALLVLYYAGHGFEEEDTGLSIAAKTEGDGEHGHSGALFLDVIRLLHVARSDVLLIVDCCYTSKAFLSSRHGRRKFELLTSSMSLSPSPGKPRSFTAALIKVLQNLLNEPKYKEGFSTSILYSRLYHHPDLTQYTPLLFDQSQFDYGKIWLRPQRFPANTEMLAEPSVALDLKIHMSLTKKDPIGLTMNELARALQYLPYVHHIDFSQAHASDEDAVMFLQALRRASNVKNAIRLLKERVKQRKREDLEGDPTRRIKFPQSFNRYLTKIPSSTIQDWSSGLIEFSNGTVVPVKSSSRRQSEGDGRLTISSIQEHMSDTDRSTANYGREWERHRRRRLNERVVERIIWLLCIYAVYKWGAGNR